MIHSATKFWINHLIAAAVIFMCSFQTSHAGFDITSKVSVETRMFRDTGFYAAQDQINLSVAGELEFAFESKNRQHQFIFKPFVRIDEHDSERTHLDVREMLWTTEVQGVTLRAGLGKVFWGATEFYHLVNVVNQTDGVESVDGEDKLGQPMISLSTPTTNGAVELFLLPRFRERTFPGPSGRLRPPLEIQAGRAIYESSRGRDHLDVAARWSASFENTDIGVSFFRGTNRNPIFVPEFSGPEPPTLRPFYGQIEQVGLDAQTTKGNWLLKFESLYRNPRSSDDYTAFTGGFEYSFIGLLGSRVDLGVVVEYMRDQRGAKANHFRQDDIGVGLRLALNDTQSSELLLGLLDDQDSGSQVVSLEASRRLGENYKMNIEGYVFSGAPEGDVLVGFENDDFLSVEVVRFF